MLNKFVFYIFLTVNFPGTRQQTTLYSGWWWWGKEVTQHPFKYDDDMGRSDKEKVQNISSELIMDAKLKLRQVLAITAQHSAHEGYHYGMLIGKIREHYKTMLEYYKTALRRPLEVNKKQIFPPSTMVARPIHYVHFMHATFMLGREIDEMVQILVTAHEEKTKRQQNQLGFIPRARGEVINERKARKMVDKFRRDESRLKSKIREEHLMRKIGLPTNTSTTKKRFINRWPVEDTWRLNEY